MREILLRNNYNATFTADCTYVNKSLLYHLAYTSYDNDGYEYPYNLFDLARDPSIIDKIANL